MQGKANITPPLLPTESLMPARLEAGRVIRSYKKRNRYRSALSKTRGAKRDALVSMSCMIRVSEQTSADDCADEIGLWQFYTTESVVCVESKIRGKKCTGSSCSKK